MTAGMYTRPFSRKKQNAAPSANDGTTRSLIFVVFLCVVGFSVQVLKFSVKLPFIYISNSGGRHAFLSLFTKAFTCPIDHISPDLINERAELVLNLLVQLLVPLLERSLSISRVLVFFVMCQHSTHVEDKSLLTSNFIELSL